MPPSSPGPGASPAPPPAGSPRPAGASALIDELDATAKAMRDDRERCLAAGAGDYLARPVDVDMRLSLLRVWMPR